jgi:hypothetical protein
MGATANWLIFSDKPGNTIPKGMRVVAIFTAKAVFLNGY